MQCPAYGSGGLYRFQLRASTASGALEHAPHAREIVGGIDARMRSGSSNGDPDAMAVPQRAQLFEGFESLERRRCELGIGREKRGAVRVNSDVAVGRQFRWNLADTVGECITRMRNGGAAKVERATLAVEHHFDDVQIGRASCRERV